MERAEKRPPGRAFSLHDLSTRKIWLESNHLHVQFDYMIDYSQEGEKYYDAGICFENVELDYCQIYILDSQENRAFTGVYYPLEHFLKEYPQFIITIILEYYSDKKCLWQGELSMGNKIFPCQLQIMYEGCMNCRVGKEKE